MIKLNTRVLKLHYKLLQECRGHGKKRNFMEEEIYSFFAVS